jgi:hypothetical protein
MSIFPCPEFLDRRRCLDPCGQQQARRARLPRDVFACSISLGVASTAAAQAVPAAFETGVLETSVFEVLCAGATTVGLVNAGLSSSIAAAVASNDREGTMPLDRGRSSVSRPLRCAEVVKRGLYTVEGRQTGDLRQKCGSALIRKAKPPHAIVWKVVPNLQAADEAH